MITVYSENHTKHVSALYGQNAKLMVVKASGTYYYHYVVKG
jgi:hypothetical protein